VAEIAAESEIFHVQISSGYHAITIKLTQKNHRKYLVINVYLTL